MLFRPFLLEQLAFCFDRGLREFSPADRPLPFVHVAKQSEARSLSLAWLKENPSEGLFILRFDDTQSVPRLAAAFSSTQAVTQDLPSFDLVEALFGRRYSGHLRDGLDAFAQFSQFSTMYPEQVQKLVPRIHKSVFLNFPFWESRFFEPEGLDSDDRNEVLGELHSAWMSIFPQIRLGTPVRELSALIFQAVVESNIDAIKGCVDAGVDINERSSTSQVTPLLVAIDRCEWPVVQEILDLGGDPNLAGPGGLSPLAHAIRVSVGQAGQGSEGSGISVEPSSHLVEILLNAGANPDLTGAEGKNAWRIAREHKHFPALKLFSDAGYGKGTGLLQGIYRWFAP